MATISKRTSKKGEVSYLIRVSLGYNKKGQQIVKSMTYKPESGMKPKAVEKELNRQAVLFEEQAKQDYEAQLQRESEQQNPETFLEYTKPNRKTVKTRKRKIKEKLITAPSLCGGGFLRLLTACFSLQNI